MPLSLHGKKCRHSGTSWRKRSLFMVRLFIEFADEWSLNLGCFPLSAVPLPDQAQIAKMQKALAEIHSIASSCLASELESET
eukprot:m.503400 g.503400  ORF g.503400 m.503400 type:complete len:82 (-) comp57346_c0_seq9:2041-2286(-)